MSIEKDKRIKEEQSKLLELFKNAPQNDLMMLMPLIQNASFMKVTLDDLQSAINEKGCAESYKNGENQFGIKQSAELQAYNTTIKNYSAILMKLFAVLPHPEMKEKSLIEEVAELMKE